MAIKTANLKRQNGLSAFAQMEHCFCISYELLGKKIKL